MFETVALITQNNNYCNMFTLFQIYNGANDSFMINSIETLSIKSYDCFVIYIDAFIDFFNENIIKIIEEIEQTKKQIIYVYGDALNINNDAYSFLSSHYNVSFSLNDGNVIERFNNYTPNYKLHNHELIAMKGNHQFDKCFIKNTNLCLLKKISNGTIIHDIDYDFESDNPYSESVYKDYSELFDYLLSKEIYVVPEWVKNINILDDNDLIEKKKKIELNVISLIEYGEEIDRKINSNMEYKKLLYETGDELVKIVKKVLIEMLNVTINDIDLKKHDLMFELGGKIIFVEVKGENNSIKRQNIVQTQSHVYDYLERNNISEEELNYKYKGLLIKNPYIKDSYSNKIKKDFYSEETINDVKRFGICCIDTCTLLTLYTEWRTKGNNDLKRIILEDTYVEPRFIDF